MGEWHVKREIIWLATSIKSRRIKALKSKGAAQKSSKGRQLISNAARSAWRQSRTLAWWPSAWLMAAALSCRRQAHRLLARIASQSSSGAPVMRAVTRRRRHQRPHVKNNRLIGRRESTARHSPRNVSTRRPWRAEMATCRGGEENTALAADQRKQKARDSF